MGVPYQSDPADAEPVVAVDGWTPARRRLAIGLVLTVTLVAFESLAVATVMPLVSDDLGGLGLYGWVFSGFFLGSLLGIVLGGQAADRRGPRVPYATGMLVFGAGLAVASVAVSMEMLVAGRILQGIGNGVLVSVAYASIGRALPPGLRPRMFAILSTAWVVPGLVGPAVASALAEVVTWRAIFFLLLPFVAVAAVLTGSSLPRGAAGAAADADEAPVAAVPDRHRDALVLVGGTALVLVALGGMPLPVAAVLMVVGGVPAVGSFVRLVPRGTLRFGAGLPAAVAGRGILTFAFFGTNAYVSLALTDGRGLPTWGAGAVLTAATLSWTAGAWLQQRLVHHRGPRWLARRGFASLALGIGGMVAVLSSVPAWLAWPAWMLGGLGVGLCHAAFSVTVLAAARSGEEGVASSSLQLSDVLGISLGTGLTGTFVAVGEANDWSVPASLTPAFLLTLAVALVGLIGVGRLPRMLPD